MKTKNIPVRRIHIAGETNRSSAFSIRLIEDVLPGKDMVQDLHRHDYFYILALKKGMGSHEIDFTSYEIQNDTIFFIRPGQVHQLSLKAGSTGYLMQFSRDFYYPGDQASTHLLRRASHKNFCRLDSKKFEKLLTILAYIFEENTNKQEGYIDVIKANMGIFFIELLRYRQHITGTSNSSIPYSLQRLEEFFDLLEINISKHKSVTQYADMLNLSTYQLNAITKEALGKTSSEVINEYIILESKRNLLATSGQVNQIAFDLGYEDVSYFIRFFKKHTGHSPEAFRNYFK